jgi:hypothetical protein
MERVIKKYQEDSLMSDLTASERQFIREAYHFLERDSVLLSIANAVGKPASLMQKVLPAVAQDYIAKAVNKSLSLALQTSLKTLNNSGNKEFRASLKDSTINRVLHGSLAMGSGAMGGFFGGVGLVFELPVTTTIMMRNIAAIATSFGFSKSDPETALECLYVFSLGSRSKNDDEFDSAYYSSRAAMSVALRNSAQYMASSSTKALLDSLRKGSAPIIINFIARIAAYFEIVVTEKMVAGAVPIVGSVGAAAVNLAFTDYFGQAAKYHFGLLALEKKYGEAAVKEFYLAK